MKKFSFIFFQFSNAIISIPQMVFNRVWSFECNRVMSVEFWVGAYGFLCSTLGIPQKHPDKKSRKSWKNTTDVYDVHLLSNARVRLMNFFFQDKVLIWIGITEMIKCDELVLDYLPVTFSVKTLNFVTCVRYYSQSWTSTVGSFFMILPWFRPNAIHLITGKAGLL